MALCVSLRPGAFYFHFAECLLVSEQFQFMFSASFSATGSVSRDDVRFYGLQIGSVFLTTTASPGKRFFKRKISQVTVFQQVIGSV